MRVLIIGEGMIVYSLARLFSSKGYEIAIVNRYQRECERLSKDFKATVVNGDGTIPEFQEKAGAKGSDILVSVSDQDYRNFATCKVASQIFEIPTVLSLVNDPDNVDIFGKLGIKYTVSKSNLMVSLLEKTIESDYVTPLLEYADGQALMYEALITETMPAVGFEADKIEIPEDADIVGVIRNGKFKTTERHFVIEPGDRILLLTSPQSLAYSVRLLCGTEA